MARFALLVSAFCNLDCASVTRLAAVARALTNLNKHNQINRTEKNKNKC